jgi:Ferric reductase NAD binding domain/FAD-binding domain/Ferric reductase like transmembrane component
MMTNQIRNSSNTNRGRMTTVTADSRVAAESKMNAKDDPKDACQNDYKSYFPYASSMTEAPMFHLLFTNLFGRKNDCLRSIVSLLYKIRWMLSYPFRTVVAPHWMPYHSLIQITIGEILLCAPIFYFFIEGYYASTDTSVVVTGDMTAYVILLSYLSANKSNSLFAFLFGIPFERMISFHYLCGVCVVTLTIFHIYISYEHNDIGTSITLTSFLTQDRANILGSVATACIFALVALSFYSKFFRYYAFQLWLVSHITLAMAVLVALYLHNVGIVVLIIAVWWLLDLMVRYVIMAMCQYRVPSNHVHLRQIAHDKDDPASHTHEPAVEISLLKPVGFTYSPGQFLQVAVPSISIFEFHPVSISSAPHEEYVTMHFRDRGDWTHKLVQLTDTKTSTAIWMEGPYGSLSVDIHDTHRYQMVLLLCAGIGVTPIQSIGKSILYEYQHHNRPLKYMNMVWVVRDMNIVHDVPPLGACCMDRCSSDDSNVQIDIYCTRTNDSSNNVESTRIINEPQVCDQEKGRQLSNGIVGGDCSYVNVKHGQRPDINAIFQQMKQRANEMGEYNIAVFACGPSGFMTDIQVACRTNSQSSIGCHSNHMSGVYFDLHTEHFEF